MTGAQLFILFALVTFVAFFIFLLTRTSGKNTTRTSILTGTA